MTGLFGDARICGVIAAETADEMMAQVQLGVRKTKTLELRLDYLHGDEERVKFFGWLASKRSKVLMIATCRSEQSGGLFRGTREGQIDILVQAVRAGCQWCDVEIETADKIAGTDLYRALAPARVMISYHDFKKTPRNLASLARRLARLGGSATKIATHCDSISDGVRISEIARGRRNIVAVPMGEVGFAARILSLRTGSVLAYAAVKQPTAPGQLSLNEMVDLYHAGEITRKTRVYGVIGNPIGHSLSPLLYNTAFQARKFDGVMVPFLVRNLRDFLKALGSLGIKGFAITIPHKESILRYLDECDPLAARIGAVNTVVVRGARLHGYNTDYIGVLRSLERHMNLSRSHILLFGAGGAARAAAFALKHVGSTVTLCSRRPEQARALAKAVGARMVERSELRRENFDAIVNCTPVGMHPHGGSPLTAAELNCRIVMDMVYRPLETELLQLARAKGIVTISGVEMFLAQGFVQYKIWTGDNAPEFAMRRAVTGALDRAEVERKKSVPAPMK